jgi:endonuclease/exonuclease/phosphatase family metal-dependent hydrolase
MARRNTPDYIALAQTAWGKLAVLPWKARVAVMVVAAVVAGFAYLANRPRPAPPVPPPTAVNPDGSAGFQFAFWNVENLFDDSDDNRRAVDETYDNPFAHDGALRAEKYDHIAAKLLDLNAGRGPDVIACCEVESVRAAELLRDELNRKLDAAKFDPALHYTNVAAIDLNAGRHINACVITRLNLAGASTKQHGRLLRIIETRLTVNGHDLTIVASHWTSQLTQRDGGDGDDGRAKYADLVYGIFADAATADPAVDFLACGDFNSTPDSQPVAVNLHATGDRSRVVPVARGPMLLDLLAGKNPADYGTIWYGGKPLIYDHVCISPGMLDPAGWSADPDSVRVFTDGLIRGTRRDPWRFGNPNSPPIGGRGYSDHLPVTVNLRVAPPAK